MKFSKSDIINKILLIQVLLTLYGNMLNPYTTIVYYVLNFIILVFALDKAKKGIKYIYLPLLFFVLYIFLSTLWGNINLYFIFSDGLRYFFALLIYFVSSEYLTSKYWNIGMNIMLISQGINVFFTLYQKMIMQLSPDFSNGIFGFIDYNNAEQGMFSLVISIIAMIYFFDKKWSYLRTLYTIGTSCIVCAFSEVKAYYILLLLSLIVVYILRIKNSNVTKYMVKFSVIIAILFFLAYKILEAVFPANLEVMFNLSKYILYEEYGARNGAGRLSTITYIYTRYFADDKFSLFFGRGLGTDTNEFAYTIGKIFSSFGIVGIILLLSWCVTMITTNLKRIKTNSEVLICVVIIIFSLITTQVWNIMFTQFSYILFWILGSQSLKNETNRFFEKESRL